MRLCERSRIKDLLQIPRADTLLDDTLNGLIEQASEEVAHITRRAFEYAARTEFHASYDQEPEDPTPQYIHLEAWSKSRTDSAPPSPRRSQPTGPPRNSCSLGQTTRGWPSEPGPGATRSDEEQRCPS
jgi:hypothetical protein